MQRLIGSKFAKAWLARALVVLLLAAQGLVAAYACPSAADGVRQGFVIPGESAGDGVGCHDQGQAPTEANLCLAHCTSGDETTQSADRSSLDVPALPGGPPMNLARRPAPEFTVRDTAVPPCSDPPIPIRFCVYRS